MVDVALVDFGGTLADETFMRRDSERFPSWTSAYVAVVEELRESWDTGRLSSRQVATHLAGLLDATPDEVHHRMLELCRSLTFYPAINAALTRRRARGQRQALVTVNPDLFDVIARHYSLRDRFDVIVTSWEHGTADKVALCRYALHLLGGNDARSSVLIDNIGDHVDAWVSCRGHGYVFRDDRALVNDVLEGRVPGFIPADIGGRLPGLMPAEDARERLGETFDRAADLYQQARPGYPAELFDHLLEVTGLLPEDRLLEVGCATGKATLPLAQRGYRIVCVEPGRALAAAARENLAGLDVDVVEARFEDWLPTGEPVAMVFAATAWHWVDPAVRYRRAADALRPGGYLAVWGAGHVFPYDGDPFFEEIQDIYDEIGGSRPPGTTLPRPQELADDRVEIEASGLFEVVDVTQYDWETFYDARGYIDLLNTFSGHIAMQDWQRNRLYGEIRRRLAARPDGRLRRHWGGVLHIARRRDRVPPE
jgi:SAM-dependent methyltransferase/FMN phosphatase YigB (HAD superfamily)